MRKPFGWGILAVAVLAIAVPAQADYSQGFETDASGWFDTDDGWDGDITRVSSGTGGVTSSSGSFHAIVTGGGTDAFDSAPYTQFDGYRTSWPGTITTSVDIFLDTTWTAGTGFDYSVAASSTANIHVQDFIFHVSSISGQGLYIGSSNNSNWISNNQERLDLHTLANNYEVTSSGWYTFEHVLYEDGLGNLAVDLNVYDSSNSLVYSQIGSGSGDPISGIGGNRYGWFTFNSIANGIAVDNASLTVAPVPEPATATLLGLGLVGVAFGRYRRQRKA